MYTRNTATAMSLVLLNSSLAACSWKFETLSFADVVKAVHATIAVWLAIRFSMMALADCCLCTVSALRLLFG